MRPVGAIKYRQKPRSARAYDINRIKVSDVNRFVRRNTGPLCGYQKDSRVGLFDSGKKRVNEEIEMMMDARLFECALDASIAV